MNCCIQAVSDRPQPPPCICLLFLLFLVSYFLLFLPTLICLQFHIALLLYVSILSDHICLLCLSLPSLPFPSPLPPLHSHKHAHYPMTPWKILAFLPSLWSGLEDCSESFGGQSPRSCLTLLSQEFHLRQLPWYQELSPWPGGKCSSSYGMVGVWRE